MTKKEVAGLFKFLKSVYPQFEVDQYKIDTWASLLSDQNPVRIMKNAEMFVMENKFPPTIADIREKPYEAYTTNVIDQIKEWEANAARK